MKNKLTPDDRALIAARMSAVWLGSSSHGKNPAPIDEVTGTQAAGCFSVGENFTGTGATWAAFRLNRNEVEWLDLTKKDRSDILARCRQIVGPLNCSAARKGGVRSLHHA